MKVNIFLAIMIIGFAVTQAAFANTDSEIKKNRVKKTDSSKLVTKKNNQSISDAFMAGKIKNIYLSDKLFVI